MVTKLAAWTLAFVAALGATGCDELHCDAVYYAGLGVEVRDGSTNACVTGASVRGELIGDGWSGEFVKDCDFGQPDCNPCLYLGLGSRTPAGNYKITVSAANYVDTVLEDIKQARDECGQPVEKNRRVQVLLSKAE